MRFTQIEVCCAGIHRTPGGVSYDHSGNGLCFADCLYQTGLRDGRASFRSRGRPSTTSEAPGARNRRLRGFCEALAPGVTPSRPLKAAPDALPPLRLTGRHGRPKPVFSPVSPGMTALHTAKPASLRPPTPYASRSRARNAHKGIRRLYAGVPPSRVLPLPVMHRNACATLLESSRAIP